MKMQVSVLEEAERQLAELTGLKAVGVTRAYKDERGWHIGVEMLELGRIPSSTDVLGEYEVLLGEDGGLLRFERRRTRLRGEPFQNGESA